MDTIQKYKEQGTLLVKSFYPPSFITAAQKNCDLLLGSIYVHPDNIRSRYQYGSGTVPERFDPVTDIAPVLRSIAEDARLLELVASCIDGAPRLFKDKLILKSPGTGGYPMHQDYAWWTHLCPDPNHLVTVAVALDESNAENGAVEVFPMPEGGLIAKRRNMDTGEQDIIESQSEPELMRMRPGDILLIHPLAPHRSADNASGTFRRILYLTYCAASYGDLRTPYYRYYIARERIDHEYSNQGYFW